MFIRRRWPFVVLGALIILYVAYFGWYTLTANDRYQTEGFDLAIYEQTLWNTLHGRWFRSTYEPGFEFLLADHVEPILLLVAPLYALWQAPEMLILLQTVALALGALPVYWLARDGLKGAVFGGLSPGDETAGQGRSSAAPWPIELSALAFALVYLLYPPLHSANTFEFHPSALSAPLLLYALLFMRRRRAMTFFVFVLLAMSTKEVLPLTTAALGVYILLFRREWALGSVTLAVSAAWFALVVFAIIPAFNPGGQSQYFSGVHYRWLGDSGTEILVRLITQPGLVLQRLASQTGPPYLAGLLAPLAYLPLLGLPMLLPAVPTLVLNALSDTPFQHSLGSYFHYAAPIVPFVMVAAIDGAAFLTRHLGRFAKRNLPANARFTEPGSSVAMLLAGLILFASVVSQRQHGYLPFSRNYYLAGESKRVTAIQEVAQQVPAAGSVSTDLFPARHLSHRPDLYLYPDVADTDFLLVDASYRNWPFPPRDRYDAVQDLLQSGQYGVRDGRYGYLLLERGLDQPTIPDPFYDFVREEDPAPQYKMEVDFGGELRLVGFDLVWERPLLARAYLVLYWQALRPIDRDLRLFFVQTDPGGELIAGTELEFVEPVWYPPSRWSSSEVYRTETFHWYLTEPEKFGVAIGVVEGPGFWDLDKRLRPDVQHAPWELPLIHGDGLLWLATLDTDGRFVTLQNRR